MVSDSIVPFKMVWRQPEAVLKEPEPSKSEVNSCFLVAIRKCPSRVRPFPKHLLVLLGISKLWDKSNRDPVLMRDGQVMSPLDFGSEGGVDNGKEKELVVAGKKKKLVNKGVVPTIQGSSAKSGVKVGDSFKDPAICVDVLANFAPPSVRDSVAEMEGDTMISRMILSSCNLSALLVEGFNRFHKGMQEYEDLMKKKDRMKTSISSMKKKIDGFAIKEEAWVKKMHEVTSRHEVEVEGLKKELEALKVREKTSLEEQERLKASEDRLVSDSRWLIEHGFQ
ncbi:hypothetical protein Hanom_Chr06g00546021 [Helianthus anomalus]